MDGRLFIAAVVVGFFWAGPAFAQSPAEGVGASRWTERPEGGPRDGAWIRNLADRLSRSLSGCTIATRSVARARSLELSGRIPLDHAPSISWEAGLLVAPGTPPGVFLVLTHTLF